MIRSLGFIGGGNMARSLIGGLINKQALEPQNIQVYEPNKERAQRLKTEFGLTLARTNSELVGHCDAVLIAVKPQVLKSVLLPLSSVLTQKQPLLISIVAGIPIQSILKWAGGEFDVVRVMPNTPALIGHGACGMYASDGINQQARQFTSMLMESVGISCWLNSEDQIDSITALSGSGPAYFMLFINELIKSAKADGIDPTVAQQLAVATAIGAAKLIDTSDEPIQQLINNVTSPNGTTEAAVNSFSENQLGMTVQRAYQAAKSRSEELALELGEE